MIIKYEYKLYSIVILKWDRETDKRTDDRHTDRGTEKRKQWGVRHLNDVHGITAASACYYTVYVYLYNIDVLLSI